MSNAENTIKQVFLRLIEDVEREQQISPDVAQEFRRMIEEQPEGKVGPLLIPRMLEANCNSELVAELLAKRNNYVLYPWNVKYSEISKESQPPLPASFLVGPDWVYCSNKTLYLTNPLDESRLYEIQGSLRRDGVTEVARLGVISNMRLRGLTPATTPEELQRTSKAAARARGAINELFTEAIKANASDVHFEPMASDVAVRFRVDNALREVMRVSDAEYEWLDKDLISRCRHHERLDFMKGIEQEFTFHAPPANPVTMRLTSVPSNPEGRSESMPKHCIRVMGNLLERIPLKDLGIPNIAKNNQLTRLRLITEAKSGIILTSGRVASGKTTSLNAILAELKRNHDKRQRYAVEDTIETNLSGITRIRVDPESGMTYERVLNLILRADPDEILIGEIRTEEVARVALSAAITGHLIFSSIHAHSAVDVIPRLLDLGCTPLQISSSLRAVLSQRLVRKVCPHCSTMVKWHELTEGRHESLKGPANQLMRLRYAEAPKLYADLDFYPKHPDQVVLIKGPGCEFCGKTGYSGRLLLSELLEISPKIADMIFEGTTTHKLREQAVKEGFKEIWQHAAYEVFERNSTTMEELINALGERDITQQNAEKRASRVFEMM